MSQHDFNIANQTASNARSDLNNALSALASLSSGATAPSTTYANMLWYDTANNILKMRSEADDAWISIGTLNQSTNTFEAAAAANAATLTGTATSDIQSSALASGTANSTTFLRGDRTWQTIDVTPTTSQVLTATAGASVGAVGTYAVLAILVNGSNTEGQTRAGSQLGYTGANGGSISSGVSGTWRCMGRAETTGFGTQLGPGYNPGLWLRIS